MSRYGSDRSSVYVGLSVLVQQIKRENRCDVFTAVRKLRAQRQAMMQHLVSLKNIGCNILTKRKGRARLHKEFFWGVGGISSFRWY